MTPEKFIKRWTENDLTEKAGTQRLLKTYASCYKSKSHAAPKIIVTKKVPLKTAVGKAGQMFGSAIILDGKTRNQGAA
ncbi:hypothetical protein SAMN05421863_104729 [Nitrosomonas communis]|uniref:Uncharacterized protein n=1 Tax=Nitrosomonas communis TaxID=44574 RepID=A0A1I4T731_9PROT|nr:hypothetical protein [Nitrosomonas communis]SFM72377.1 hypothetical protein SAMN05421863_104729 [Nitrosomonas communis]